MFRYLLKLPNGLLHDPGVFVSAVPFWSLAETLRLSNGRLLRVLAIDTDIRRALLEAGFDGVFTVEPISPKAQQEALDELTRSGRRQARRKASDKRSLG